MDRCTWTFHVVAKEGVLTMRCEFTEAFSLSRKMQVLYDAAAEFVDHLHDEGFPCVLGVGPRSVTNLDDITWDIAIILHPASGADPRSLVQMVHAFIHHLNQTPLHYLPTKPEGLGAEEEDEETEDPTPLLN